MPGRPAGGLDPNRRSSEIFKLTRIFPSLIGLHGRCHKKVQICGLGRTHVRPDGCEASGLETGTFSAYSDTVDVDLFESKAQRW